MSWLEGRETFSPNPWFHKVRRIHNSLGHSWKATGPNIVKAIDDLEGVAGTVWLPATHGTPLEVEETLPLGEETTHEKQWLIGAGAGATELKLADNVNAKMFQITSGWCGIAGMKIDGNKTENSAYSTIGSSALHLQLYDMIIFNAPKHGVEYSDADCHFRNVVVEYSAKSGIYFKSAGCRDNIALGCLSALNGEHGFHVYENPDSVSFVGCFAIFNHGHGYYIQGYADHPSTNVNILGGEIFDNDKHGILMEGAQFCNIRPSLIRDNSKDATNTYDGIHLKSIDTTHCLKNIIEGVLIHSPETEKHRYGIREADDNQDYNMVHGCIVTDGATGQISLQGANSVKPDSIEI